MNDYIWADGYAKAEKYAQKVGTKKPNAWGLKDMHGNVWEWCEDWYGKQLPGGIDPSGPVQGPGRVFRGGGWNYSAWDSRSASRHWAASDFRNDDVGFRVAAVQILKREPEIQQVKLASEPNLETQIARLRNLLLTNKWYYSDNLYPPGGPEEFRDNGTFSNWNWKYWVVGTREMRVHFDRSQNDSATGIPFIFNEDLTTFRAEWNDPGGRTHIVTGTRQ